MKKPGILTDETQGSIQEAIGQLFVAHRDRINEALSNSESSSLAVSLNVSIAGDSHPPEFTVSMAYTPVKIKDHRIIRGEDPDQPDLPLRVMTAEQVVAEDRVDESDQEKPEQPEEEPKPRGRKKKAVQEDAE